MICLPLDINFAYVTYSKVKIVRAIMLPHKFVLFDATFMNYEIKYILHVSEITEFSICLMFSHNYLVIRRFYAILCYA